MYQEKQNVKNFWNIASCGEELYLKGFSKEDYNHQASERYRLELQLSFGEFEKFTNKKTLEIGVGLGADHQQLAKAGAILTGIDLTERAINHTKRRLELFNLESNLLLADAEDLPFEDNTFEALYSWGVIHHSPNTNKVVEEIHRVLKAGAFVKIMIYHKYSIIGYMLWIRYALLKLKPWLSLNEIYDKYLESPGTKAYSYKEATNLFKDFGVIRIESPLTHGDLLTSEVGARHRGRLLSYAKKFWPRRLIKKILPDHGLFLMLTMYKK
jgi:ubiquinone/menaquinone biosynthesis C-methylase UbiE